MDMQSYITKKAEKAAGWKIAGAVLCLMFAGVTVSVSIQTAAKSDWETLGIDILLLALSLWPVVRTGRHIIRRRRAMTLAHAFEQEKDDIVTVSRIEQSAPMPGAKNKIRDLVKAKYLQNVYLDWERGEVTLAAPHKLVDNNAVLSMKCPHCGGPNQVIRGRVNHCRFCGNTLIANEAKP